VLRLHARPDIATRLTACIPLAQHYLRAATACDGFRAESEWDWLSGLVVVTVPQLGQQYLLQPTVVPTTAGVEAAGAVGSQAAQPAHHPTCLPQQLVYESQVIEGEVILQCACLHVHRPVAPGRQRWGYSRGKRDTARRGALCLSHACVLVLYMRGVGCFPGTSSCSCDRQSHACTAKLTWGCFTGPSVAWERLSPLDVQCNCHMCM
jgi:hypothetical protein